MPDAASLNRQPKISLKFCCELTDAE